MISFQIQVLQKSTNRVFTIIPPVNFYYADPFIISSNKDRVVIAFEAYDRIRRKGRIDQAIIDFKNNDVKKKILLEEDFHLSYPCPILINNQLYIAPESSEVNTQFIYRLNKIGDYYKPERVASIKHRMVDATFFKLKIQDQLLVYFYTGSGNNDGLLVSGKFKFEDKDNLKLQDLNIIGRRRPAGILLGCCQPFQRANDRYGKGIDFANISNIPNMLTIFNKNFFSLCDNKHITSQIDCSHHINELDDFVCFDLLSSPKLQFLADAKFKVLIPNN
jgi:hypothetical protein